MDAYLVLENGAVFKGKQFGYDGEAFGELVFNTAMVGYPECLADPRNYGHIVCQTFPLIGNYGIFGNFKTNAFLNAYIVSEWCQVPSNFRSEGTLDTFLRDNKIPGLCGIDTRALTKMIREQGSMNAMLCRSPAADNIERLKNTKLTGAVDAVSSKEKYTVSCEVIKKKAALLNLGALSDITENLALRGCEVTVVPYNTKNFHQGFDLAVLSGGPGDPAELPEVISEIKKAIASGVPLLAFGLGHQLLALAAGGGTEKLSHGHRGANQPVKDTATGRIYISSQNHGYYVAKLPENAVMSFENAFDASCEGIEYKGFPGLSLQFFPETSHVSRELKVEQKDRKITPRPPQDMGFIYDKFMEIGE